MRSGDLNSRVTIRKRVGTGSLGQPSNTWEDVATVWANIRHLNGAESIRAGAITSIVNASIRIRNRAGVTAAMRVVHAGVNYEIQAVLPGSDGVSLDLVAKVVT